MFQKLSALLTYEGAVPSTSCHEGFYILGTIWSSRHKAAVELNHLLQEVMHLGDFHRKPCADISPEL